MVSYRKAKKSDAVAIAHLHAESWRTNYRGMLSDTYLDAPVWEDRKAFWLNRMATKHTGRYLVLAEDDKVLCGFSCVIADEDPTWGALLDNLHVLPDYQGQGIGKQFMVASANWLYSQDPDNTMYLWVFERNLPAIGFYESMGGRCVETVSKEQMDGSRAVICRYIWADLNRLLLLS
ncbi:MAG: GNAT family N-acetyltransferase [Saprospiraceae bacterium]|nr:GNAT family N-acetyltransferase [Saprospiraceae bacterium]